MCYNYLLELLLSFAVQCVHVLHMLVLFGFFAAADLVNFVTLL